MPPFVRSIDAAAQSSCTTSLKPSAETDGVSHPTAQRSYAHVQVRSVTEHTVRTRLRTCDPHLSRSDSREIGVGVIRWYKQG